jgi:SnoaL-like domain
MTDVRSAERVRNEATLRMHLGAEAAHEMAATLATLHPECVFEDRALRMFLVGREGARRHYDLWWSAFGVGLEGGLVHWVRDDLAIGESTMIGRHVGTFLDLRPTARPIRLPFVVFVKFRDGLLLGERFVYDLHGLLAQLGHACDIRHSNGTLTVTGEVTQPTPEQPAEG